MKDNYTHLEIVLDRSGSMARIAGDMEGGLEALLKEQKSQPGLATVGFTRFDSEIETVFESKDLKEVTNLKIEPRNNTRLHDAIGMRISSLGERLSKLDEDERPSKVIFVIVSDGYENDSREYHAARIKQMIEHQTNTYNWDFHFLGTNQDAIATGSNLGVDIGKCLSFSNNKSEQVVKTFSNKLSKLRGMSVEEYTSKRSAVCYDSKDRKDVT